MTDPKPNRHRGEQQEEKKWYDKTLYQVLLFAVGVALFSLVLGLILDWYIDPDSARQPSTAKKDLVQALGLITAGVAGAVGIFFTWRGQKLTRDAQVDNQRNTLDQLDNANKQLELSGKQFTLSQKSHEVNQKNTQKQLQQARDELDITRRGQITERFTQAIDQLGSESREVRLGGIYSLERTAREDEDYHWPIMEVLTAYVRKHAARKLEEESEEDLVPHDPDSQAAVNPELDIQAVLDVIGRRSKYHREDNKVEYGTLNLNATNLRGAVLQKAYLKGANFKRAYLGGADLSEADLRGANLMNAVLRGAVFWTADLKGADLTQAKCEKAVFQNSCDLQGARFHGAHLQEAVFIRAKLQGVNFGYADLRKANLSGSEFRGTGRKAYFGGAKLQGADFRDTDLSLEQLQQAHWDESTLLPDELDVLRIMIDTLEAHMEQLGADFKRAIAEETPEGKQRAEQLTAELQEKHQQLGRLRRQASE